MLPENPKRILLIDWSMIGDLVMMSPCVEALAKRYPDAEIGICGQAASITTYKSNPHIKHFISYDRSRGDYDVASFKATVNELKEVGFDMAILIHNSFGSALMAKSAGIRSRAGYRSEWRDFLLTERIRKPEERQHLIETKADLLRAIGIEVEDTSERVYIDEKKARNWVAEKLGPNFGRRRPIVAVSLGSTMEYKQWSSKSLHDFLNMFSVNSVDFVFLGTPAEAHMYEDVYSYNNTVVDLTGQTTIEELAWVMDKADLFVGPDSGPMHIAVGRQTPVVALFGPTDPAVCGPYKYERSLVYRSQQICNKCEVKYGKHIRQCLHTIDAANVYYAAQGLLAMYCNRWSFNAL